MNRRPLFVANWKMHKTVRESVAYVEDLSVRVASLVNADIAVAPPFTAIAAAAAATRLTAIAIAAQDMWHEREGAFTGEVSAAMVQDAGATMVILGHSERRRLFGETDASVNRKVRAACAAALVPIVCIGETADERERGETLSVLDRQLAEGLDGVSAADVATLVLAYEPVWAIGTGRNATTAEAREAHAHIRSRLHEHFGLATAMHCRILYGGSVKPDNAHDLIGLDDVDGALVGGASLDVQSFVDIVSRA